jgi:pSer/pThr/pTyr-binding forkhead associated (FHA) protein
VGTSRFLLALTGVNAGSVFVLGKSTTLGRSEDATIPVLDPMVSRKHACLEPDARGNMVLTDLSSTNGTHVGKKRIARRPLRSGERFRIGSSEFLFGEVEEEIFDDESLERAVELVSVEGMRATTLVSEGLVTLRPKADEGPGDTMSQGKPPETPAPKEGCGDPLHELARWRGWPRCPACGSLIKA